MRIVLDTNILARVVASPEGPAGEVFDDIQTHHLLVVSLEMLSELSRVLGYERVRALHRLDDAKLEEFVEHLEAGSLVVALTDPIPHVVPDDRDDDCVIATAVAGNCDVICTRNKHFHHPEVLDYCRARAIRILSDLQLLEELQARESPNDTD